MKITVCCVGKIKEPYFRDGIREYEKRLSRYCKLEIAEVADEKTPEHAGRAAVAAILEKEGERLLKKIQEDAFVIALAVDGKRLSSEKLAEKINSLMLQGESHIQFVVGGSLGLSSQVLARADFILSFSDFTFPHQMMRLILLEQVYRSFRIIQGEPYHK